MAGSLRGVWKRNVISRESGEISEPEEPMSSNCEEGFAGAGPKKSQVVVAPGSRAQLAAAWREAQGKGRTP